MELRKALAGHRPRRHVQVVRANRIRPLYGCAALLTGKRTFRCPRQAQLRSGAFFVELAARPMPANQPTSNDSERGASISPRMREEFFGPPDPYPVLLLDFAEKVCQILVPLLLSITNVLIAGLRAVECVIKDAR
jgi:hypothetical protein